MEQIEHAESMGQRKSLTQMAHDQVRAIVRAGDVVIDATAGNGHDTLFLMQLVGPTGVAYSFDIQQVAIDRTCRRVDDFYSISDNHKQRPELIALCQNHSRISEFIGEAHKGKIACVMFNLGYLPSGDKSIVTSSADTLRSIADAKKMLSPTGCLCILAYTGHPGGQEEADAVAALLSEEFQEPRGVLTKFPEVDVPGSPILFLARFKTT